MDSLWEAAGGEAPWQAASPMPALAAGRRRPPKRAPRALQGPLTKAQAGVTLLPGQTHGGALSGRGQAQTAPHGQALVRRRRPLPGDRLQGTERLGALPPGPASPPAGGESAAPAGCLPHWAAGSPGPDPSYGDGEWETEAQDPAAQTPGDPERPPGGDGQIPVKSPPGKSRPPVGDASPPPMQAGEFACSSFSCRLRPPRGPERPHELTSAAVPLRTAKLPQRRRR